MDSSLVVGRCYPAVLASAVRRCDGSECQATSLASHPGATPSGPCSAGLSSRSVKSRSFRRLSSQQWENLCAAAASSCLRASTWRSATQPRCMPAGCRPNIRCRGKPRAARQIRTAAPAALRSSACSAGTPASWAPTRLSSTESSSAAVTRRCSAPTGRQRHHVVPTRRAGQGGPHQPGQPTADPVGPGRQRDLLARHANRVSQAAPVHQPVDRRDDRGDDGRFVDHGRRQPHRSDHQVGDR